MKQAARARTTKAKPERPKNSTHHLPQELFTDGAGGQPHDLAHDLAQTFFELLMRHRASMQEVFSSADLSPPQMHALQCISEQPRTMRELAKAAFCEPSHLTGIVDKLETRGLVARKTAAADRRSKIVSLTRSGVAFRKRLLDRLRQPAPWMLGLSATDQEQLRQILARALLALRTPKPND